MNERVVQYDEIIVVTKQGVEPLLCVKVVRTKTGTRLRPSPIHSTLLYSATKLLACNKMHDCKSDMAVTMYDCSR